MLPPMDYSWNYPTFTNSPIACNTAHSLSQLNPEAWFDRVQLCKVIDAFASDQADNFWRPNCLHRPRNTRQRGNPAARLEPNRMQLDREQPAEAGYADA